MNPTSPCLGCKERHTICHDSCEKYIDFKTEKEQINIARIKYKESISNIARNNKR